jgi:hypothetical protein
MACHVAKRCCIILGIGGLLFSAVSTAADGGDLPWRQQSLILLIGPRSESELPDGKSMEDVIRDFDPDVAEWSILPTSPNLSKRPRGVAGGAEWQEFPQGKDQMDRWLRIMGKAWTPTEADGVDIPASGVASSWKYGPEHPVDLWFVTQFSPRYHQFHVADLLEQAAKPGVGVVRVDNLLVPPGLIHDNGGFSRDTLRAFKDWLARRKTPNQLKQLGIGSLESWDAGAELRKRRGKIEEPLVREYILFFNAAAADRWRDEVQAVERRFPGIPVGGNQAHHAPLIPYRFAILSDISHFLFVEHQNFDNAVLYRLLLAGGRHRKPLWTWFNTFPELGYYEAWSLGATPYISLCTLDSHREKGYFFHPRIPKDLYDRGARAAAFAKKHRELLRPAFRTEAKLAVIYSVPSFLYRFCSAMGIADKHVGELLQRTGDYLDRKHVPYDFEVFGHHDLWPDGNLDERLARYEMVILPEVAAISQEQYEAIQRFAARGGRIAVLKEFGSRDQDYCRREAALPTPDNIGMKPGEDYAARAFRLAVEPYAVSTSAPDTVRINILRKGDSFQMHFFTWTPSRAFTAEWTLPQADGRPWEASWVAAPGQAEAKVQIHQGKVICSVPSLSSWGFVVVRIAGPGSSR